MKPWDGSAEPPHPLQVVNVLTRGWAVHKKVRAAALQWNHSGGPNDIVAYEVVEPEDLSSCIWMFDIQLNPTGTHSFDYPQTHRVIIRGNISQRLFIDIQELSHEPD